MRFTKNLTGSNKISRRIFRLNKAINANRNLIERGQNIISMIFLFSLIFFVSPADIFSLSPVKSEIKFQITHPLKTVTGNCEKIAFSNFNARIADGKLQMANPFTITVAVEGMTTGNGNRDSNMYRVLGYPRIKLVEATILKITPVDEHRYRISGNLKIKGTEHAFDAEGLLSEEKDTSILKGRMSVLLSDYGVERPALIVAIDNTVTIDFQIQLK